MSSNNRQKKISRTKPDTELEFVKNLTIWILIRTLCVVGGFITSFYPFSLLFKRNLFHADWVGGYLVVQLIDAVSHSYNNKFIDTLINNDNEYYYITGKFKYKPNPKIFERIQSIFKEKGVEIRDCGEFSDGRYKFITPFKKNFELAYLPFF